MKMAELQVGKVFNPFKLFVGAFVPNALMRVPGLSASAKLCWSRLAQYAGENGIAFPSHKTLAEDLGMTVRSVEKPLNELQKKGLIEAIHPTGRERLQHKTVRYRFLWHPIFAECAVLLRAECAALLGAECIKGGRRSLVRRSKEPPTPQVGTCVGNNQSKAKGPNPKAEAAAALPGNSESFEQFWNAYPRKVGKKECRKIWAKLKPSAELAGQIVTAVKAHKRTDQWLKDNGEFIPHPSTFLNQARWEDELPVKPEPQRGDYDWYPTPEEGEEMLRLAEKQIGAFARIARADKRIADKAAK